MTVESTEKATFCHSQSSLLDGWGR